MATATKSATKVEYYKYARLLANGEWQYFKAPTFFGPADVAEHCCYATLCVYLPRGRRVYESESGEYIEGPVWMAWNKRTQEYGAFWKDLEKVPLAEAYKYC